jgi:hypothetical protein
MGVDRFTGKTYQQDFSARPPLALLCTENESCVTKSLGTRPSALGAPKSVTSDAHSCMSWVSCPSLAATRILYSDKGLEHSDHSCDDLAFGFNMSLT